MRRGAAPSAASHVPRHWPQFARRISAATFAALSASCARIGRKSPYSNGSTKGIVRGLDNAQITRYGEPVRALHHAERLAETAPAQLPGRCCRYAEPPSVHHTCGGQSRNARTLTDMSSSAARAGKGRLPP